MEITKQQRHQIEQIADSIQCPYDLECYKSQFEQLSEVEVWGGSEYILWCKDCMEKENRKSCKFRLPYADGHLCRCPLRCYVAKNFHK